MMLSYGVSVAVFKNRNHYDLLPYRKQTLCSSFQWEILNDTEARIEFHFQEEEENI